LPYKAIGLISGGLDSLLAAKLILDQGISVLGIKFVSPFCTCPKEGCLNQAKELGFPLKVIPLREEFIRMLKAPKYGYGKNFNPCIDCRILIFSKAKEIMEEEKAEFIFTGEVLGERPMSQNRWAMRVIEKESGLEGLVLRPLSAKLLPPTRPEERGIVDREKLLTIRGRSRKPQMALAEKLGIKNYPTPAGGCLLTNKEFAQKVRDALNFGEETIFDMELLKIGRHFRLKSGAKVIVGRDEKENAFLSKIGKEGKILQVKDFPGPVTILRRSEREDDLIIAARLCARYSDAREKEEVIVICDGKEIKVKPFSEAEVAPFRIIRR